MELEFSDRDTRAGAPPLHGARLEERTADPVDRPTTDGQRVHSMPEPQDNPAASHRLAHPSLKWRYDARAGPPRDVKARHGIPRGCGPVAPSLRPAHHREESNALCMQPRPFLAGRKREICLGPLSGPMVFLPIEPGRRHPVLGRELVRIAHTEAPLLCRVDEEEAAKRPEGLR